MHVPGPVRGPGPLPPACRGGERPHEHVPWAYLEPCSTFSSLILGTGFYRIFHSPMQGERGCLQVVAGGRVKRP